MASEQKTEVENASESDRADQIAKLLCSEPLPMIQSAVKAFRRDLPELQMRHRGQWVAYHGDRRIAIGRSQLSLYELCFQHGLTRDEFVVCGIDEGVFDPDESIDNISDV